MIEIAISPEEFKVKAALLRERQGIVIHGTEGVIEKMGVKASYLYKDGLLSISILDKPFFLSDEMCEQQLRAWL
jgi:hypothetical protein